MNPICTMIIGTGNRGLTYASYCKLFPNEMEIFAVAAEKSRVESKMMEIIYIE